MNKATRTKMNPMIPVQEPTCKIKKPISYKLSGRYCILPTNHIDSEMHILDFSTIGQVAFEDSKEAVLYELTWS